MKYVLIVLLLAIAAVLSIAAFKPDDFKASRSITIAAPADTIFPHVNNLKKFNEWNPWAKVDPAAKIEFEGPDEGVGAKMEWEGNNNVGEGSMTISEITANELIKFNMEFEKPMEDKATAEFTFKQTGENTEVTWSMFGTQTYFKKVMSVFMDCEKIVGGQFEKGLADLKVIAEKEKN